VAIWQEFPPLQEMAYRSSESPFVADYTTLHFSLALLRRYYHNPDFIDPKNCFAIEYSTYGEGTKNLSPLKPTPIGRKGSLLSKFLDSRLFCQAFLSRSNTWACSYPTMFTINK